MENIFKKFVKLHFGSFKLFPNSKIDFWPFLKSQKMDDFAGFEIDFFDFTSFFDLDFLKILIAVNF